jgi:hypothetical protein
MPVFISHRTADDRLAKQVAYRLKQNHKIDCYIDDIDAETRRLRGTAGITALLVQRLNSCTNLLAIVTANTEGSWWVPFEIGVARQAPRVITSFTDQEDSSLPEYLLEWPRLRGEAAIDTFAALYKRQQALLNEQVIEKRATASQQVSTVDQFHRSLKAALGQ